MIETVLRVGGSKNSEIFSEILERKNVVLACTMYVNTWTIKESLKMNILVENYKKAFVKFTIFQILLTVIKEN